jgi:CheY-like chemotaxis protein
MIKQSSRLYAKNWEAVRTGENLLNQEVDKEMYREIYLTDRRFNMISRAKKYVAVLLAFVCVCMIFSPLTAYAAEDSSQHETVKVGFFAMDGYMTTREIRTLRNNRKANIPIVAMTANAFEEDKKKAFKAGMNAHIAKPIDINTILAVFDQVFGV